jgi:hypothetical protein
MSVILLSHVIGPTIGRSGCFRQMNWSEAGIEFI